MPRKREVFAPLGDPTPEGTRIDLDHVTKRYQYGEIAVTGLEDANLHVDEQSFVVILGTSGERKDDAPQRDRRAGRADEGTVA